MCINLGLIAASGASGYFSANAVGLGNGKPVRDHIVVVVRHFLVGLNAFMFFFLFVFVLFSTN